MKLNKAYFKNVAILAAQFADNKKAKNIKVIDLLKKSSMTDYIVIATIESFPQLEAVQDEITKGLKEHKMFRLHLDGGTSRTWRICDYGGLFVHIITKEERQFYGLDKIYHFGKQVEWEEEKKSISKPKKSTPAKKAGK
jgi:ribosome-associated protein